MADKTIASISTVFAVVFGVVGLVILLSFIPTALWYTFDDSLAKALELPLLGHMPVFAVYPFCLFVGMLTKTTYNSGSN